MADKDGDQSDKPIPDTQNLFRFGQYQGEIRPFLVLLCQGITSAGFLAPGKIDD